MTSKSLSRIIKILVFAVIVATPLFFLNDTVFPAIISKTAMFQALVEAAFFLWLALAVADRKSRPGPTSVFIGLLAFLAALLLVSVLGADPFRSFWSTYARMFGVATILHLAALAIVVSSVFNARDRRRLMCASLVTAFVAGIIAVVQLKYPVLPGLMGGAIGVNVRSGSTFDNPSFLAGYMIFNFFVGLYLLFSLDAKSAAESAANPARRSAVSGKILFAFLVLSVLLSAAVVLLTQTRGAILGLGAGIFILISFFAARPPQLTGKLLGAKKFYAAIVMVILALCSVFWFTRSNPFWDNVPGLRRFKDISVSLNSEEFQPRLIALRAAWRGFLERPVLGWGPENFNIVFDKYYDPKALESSYSETRFDKPHNFFAELLVTGGLLLAVSFAALIFLFVRQAWRLRSGILGQIAVAAVVAYLIQNFFLFDTLGPALMFYLFVGLIDGEYRSEQETPAGRAGARNGGGASVKDRGPSRISAGAVGVFAAMALAIIYFLNVQTVTAAYYEYWGFQYLAGGKVQQGADYFRSALNTRSPYHFDYVKDYATAMAQAYFYNGDIVPPEEVKFAVGEMEKARDAHPLDAFNHYVLIDMYNQISAIDPSYYLPLAEKEAAAALKLSPGRQEVYFSLSKTKYLEGKSGEAIGLVKYALNLDPNVPDAHFYYGLLAFATKDPNTGYGEIKEALKLKRAWRIFYEPRTVADFFADNGHLDEAIGLYETALGMQPNDTETRIKLGAAYYYWGNKEKARVYFAEASRHFDFTKSSAYPQLKPILDDLGIR